MNSQKIQKPENLESEAERARSVYDDLVRRINKFQAELKDSEKLVLEVSSAPGIPTDAVGLRGATIWFRGENRQGGAVWIVQHYTQMNVLIMAARLTKGEKPRPIGFLTEKDQ